MAEWDRRDDESTRAYAAFRAYLELGPGRSLDKVGIRLRGGQPGGGRGATSRIETWSSRHDWVRRAAAWDRHAAERDREAELKTRGAGLARRLGEREAAAERVKRALTVALQRAETLLSF